MFKDKWWRDDAARGASEHRQEFIQYMSPHATTVWKPTDASGRKSATARITFHSLDSLLWEFVGSDDIEGITFADRYLFYSRCPVLAFKRTHSTGGKPSLSRRAASKGKGKGVLV